MAPHESHACQRQLKIRVPDDPQYNHFFGNFAFPMAILQDFVKQSMLFGAWICLLFVFCTTPLPFPA